MLRQQIINDISHIQRPDVLNQVFEYMRLLNRTNEGSNIQSILAFSGRITKENANELLAIINEEFNSIEGEW